MVDIIEKECNKHGLTEFSFRKDNRYRCKKCSSEAVTNRRRKLKELSVAYKGGECSKCGYSKCIAALEFHHLHDKSFGLSLNGFTRSWQKIKLELDKCILLCANCHRENHYTSE